jgi:Tannase and feruloyl esterase
MARPSPCQSSAALRLFDTVQRLGHPIRSLNTVSHLEQQIRDCGGAASPVPSRLRRWPWLSIEDMAPPPPIPGTRTATGATVAERAGHPENIINFGYRAIHLTTVNAKAVVTAYATSPNYAYFSGCSTDGRQCSRKRRCFQMISTGSSPVTQPITGSAKFRSTMALSGEPPKPKPHACAADKLVLAGQQCGAGSMRDSRWRSFNE